MKKKDREKIQQLEGRLDILLAFVNELVLKDKGVALMWYDQYLDATKLLEENDSKGEKTVQFSSVSGVPTL